MTGEPRWSTAVRCARAAAYQGLGVEGIPFSEATERRFLRGSHVGRVIAESVAANLTAQGRRVEVEVECPWPAWDPRWMGHADIRIPDEATTIEVLSSTDGSFPRVKALQAVGYAIANGDRDAKVLVVNPATYEERVYPVDVEALRDEVTGIQRAVHDAVTGGGDLPERLNGDPAATPGSWECQDCPFRKACYRDWQPQTAGDLPATFAPDVERLAELDRLIRSSKADDLVEERDAIRARIAPHLTAGGEYRCGRYLVRRTEVKGRRTFGLGQAEAAGHTLPPALEAFVTTTTGHDRWTVKEVEA